MIEMTREKNGVLRSNLKCKICKSPFEFIDDKNGFATVKHINMISGRDESIDFEVNAKCPLCNYRAVYNGRLKL